MRAVRRARRAPAAACARLSQSVTQNRIFTSSASGRKPRASSPWLPRHIPFPCAARCAARCAAPAGLPLACPTLLTSFQRARPAPRASRLPRGLVYATVCPFPAHCSSNSGFLWNWHGIRGSAGRESWELLGVDRAARWLRCGVASRWHAARTVTRSCHYCSQTAAQWTYSLAFPAISGGLPLAGLYSRAVPEKRRQKQKMQPCVASPRPRGRRKGRRLALAAASSAAVAGACLGACLGACRAPCA